MILSEKSANFSGSCLSSAAQRWHARPGRKPGPSDLRQERILAPTGEAFCESYPNPWRLSIVLSAMGFLGPDPSGATASLRSRRFSLPEDRLTIGNDEAIMNIQPNLRMSKTAFIEWNAAEEQRCELVGGRVVMMPGVSRVHGRIVRRLVIALTSRLNPRQWEVIAEFGLDAGPDTLRYPDIIVDRAGGSDKDRVATRAGVAGRGIVPINSGNRSRRQGGRVSPDSKRRRLHRACAGRPEGMAVESNGQDLCSATRGPRPNRGRYSSCLARSAIASVGNLRRH